MSSTNTASGKLIGLIHETQFNDLPAQVVQDTKRLIADSIACALGACRFEAARIVAEVAADLGGPGSGAPASVLGTNLKVSPAAATSANMYLGNYLDADDTYLNFGHPAVGAVFAALAFAENLGLSGEAFIAAVALGYEVGCRVGVALDFVREKESGEIQAVSGNLGWYNFCVAGSSGKALGLDAGQFNNAFGLAGWTAPIQTGDFFAPATRPGKHMLKSAPVGFQGMNGVMAAQLAQRGFVAEQDIFDAPEKFWIAFGALGLNRERLLSGLGKNWQVSRTSLKSYSGCRFGHPALDMFNKLLKLHNLRPEEIEKVVVRTLAMGVDWLGGAHPPRTPSDMQFNIPMAIAATAYGSDLGPAWQSPESIVDQRLLAFARKVQVEGNPESMPVVFQQMLTEGRFQRIPNELRIAARGQIFSDSSDSAWGDPWSEKTRMTDAQLKDKFLGYAAAALPAKSEQAFEALFNLEQINNVATELGPLLQPD